MKEINLDNYLIDRERELTLCGKKVIIKPLSINRSLVATKLYQDAQEMINSELTKTKDGKIETAMSNLNFSKKYIGKLIDACIFIVKPVGFFNMLKNTISGNSLNRKWIMNNCTVEQLEGFINEIIKPMLGEKKNPVKNL